jgi:hypothetical protein
VQGIRGLVAAGLVLVMMAAIAVAGVGHAQAGGGTGAGQIAVSCQGGPTSTAKAGCIGIPSTACSTLIPGAAACFTNIGGFWFWCQTPTASNGYKGECNGAIYQFELTSGVGAYQINSVTGDATGTAAPFTATVGPGGSGECAFTISSSLLKGQSNAIPAVCTGTVNFLTGTTTGAFVVGVDSSGKFVGAVPGFAGVFTPGVATLT